MVLNQGDEQPLKSKSRNTMVIPSGSDPGYLRFYPKIPSPRIKPMWVIMSHMSGRGEIPVTVSSRRSFRLKFPNRTESVNSKVHFVSTRQSDWGTLSNR